MLQGLLCLLLGLMHALVHHGPCAGELHCFLLLLVLCLGHCSLCHLLCRGLLARGLCGLLCLVLSPLHEVTQGGVGGLLCSLVGCLCRGGVSLLLLAFHPVQNVESVRGCRDIRSMGRTRRRLGGLCTGNLCHIWGGGGLWLQHLLHEVAQVNGVLSSSAVCLSLWRQRLLHNVAQVKGVLGGSGVCRGLRRQRLLHDVAQVELAPGRSTVCRGLHSRVHAFAQVKEVTGGRGVCRSLWRQCLLHDVAQIKRILGGSAGCRGLRLQHLLHDIAQVEAWWGGAPLLLHPIQGTRHGLAPVRLLVTSACGLLHRLPSTISNDAVLLVFGT
mmetsp:Transcript_48891/g.141631  ORF Transcript_48891/g.141631 Transcript_48891/m.141631 type:complete len:328 (+) Transcript_48891:1887-2870(+)